jgi:signal transduction histidine kinase
VIGRPRAAFEEAHTEAASAVLLAVALLEAAGAIFDAGTVPPRVRDVIVGVDLGLVALCLALRAAYGGGLLAGWRADATWFAVGALVSFNVLLTMELTGQPAYAALLMLVVVGAGTLMRSPAVFAAVSATIATGWMIVGWRWGVDVDSAPYHAFGLLAATVMGGVLLVTRARTNARIAVLRLRDRVRGERLRRALAAARGTLADRDRAEYEKEALRAALSQAQKLEAVGRLSAAVANDIDNVLISILSAAEMLRADAQLDAAARDDLATIVGSARRGADFTRNLLAVGRRGKHASDLLDPAEIIEGAIQRHTLPVEITLEVQLAHGDARVEGDLDQLSQVVVNLLTHACASMRDGGSIVVRTSALRLEGNEAHRRAVTPGVYVVFSVSDSGEGMATEDRQRAFEPFYEGDGESAGLGLAMVYGASRNHGGIAEIESSLGRGTTVTVYLPEADTAAPARDAPSSTAFVAKPRADLRGKTVLLVDDEPSVRAVARRILERMDVRVREAENGRRALVAYAAEGPFDLVIVDLAMPVMNGTELFTRLRATDPAARIVVVSGVAALSDAMELVAAGAAGVVEKPYTPGSLARAVRVALRPMP